MRVLLIEDNDLHAQSIRSCLEKAFTGVRVSILSTEHAVVSNMEKIATSGVHIIILDLMLPWCEPAPDMPELPTDYDDEGGPYRAGIRCLKRFLDRKELCQVPVIVHSVIDSDALRNLPAEIPPNVLFLSKPLEPERMVQTVESFLLTLKPQRRPPSRMDSLVDATEMKVGLGDIKIDIKKALKRNS